MSIDDPSRPDRKSLIYFLKWAVAHKQSNADTPCGPTENPFLIFRMWGSSLCAPQQDNVDDDDNPSRPDRKSSFMFPSVGQTLRCVRGRLSIGRLIEQSLPTRNRLVPPDLLSESRPEPECQEPMKGRGCNYRKSYDSKSLNLGFPRKNRSRNSGVQACDNFMVIGST
jgi:hypothetical protein